MAKKKRTKFTNFTADNPLPKPGERTDVDGDPRPDAFFENESDPEAVEKSLAVSEKQIDKEEAAIDALLDGDDELFDKLDY